MGTASQSGTYGGFSLSNGTNTVNLDNGIVLTSGLATGIVVPDNTDTSFDGDLDTAGDADMSAVLADAGAPSSSPCVAGARRRTDRDVEPSRRGMPLQVSPFSTRTAD